ncbi:MAG: Ada metal-binding domain-containing protein [Candidatus Paceibacterota bacterium]
MSIQNKKEDGKSYVDDISFDSLEEKGSVHTSILLILLLIFSGLSAFALGRLSVKSTVNQRGVVIETVVPEFLQGSEETTYATPGDRKSEGVRTTETPFLVASKNSDKYHFPWCSSAKRIKPENLISFSSYEEAQNAGYTPASNCDGLQ